MKEAARIIVEDCMGTKKSEQVLIVVDRKSRVIGDALFEAAKNAGAEAMLMEMLEREVHGAEVPPAVAAAMKSVDVVIAPTSKSLSHTQARLEATKNGVRIASMPTIDEELMSRAMSADYVKIEERSIRLRDLITHGKRIHLTTPAGTDLEFFTDGREAMADTGRLQKKGSFGNLPAGEALIAPMEGKTNGIAIIDGTMVGIGPMKTPMKWVVQDGYATEITGGEQAQIILDLLRDKGKEGRNIAELGIGTNEKAKLSGNPLEDEKVLGTVHVALGDNSTFGGKVIAHVHLDGIMMRPTLLIDDRVIIRDGEIIV